jgi:hypothetical protein
MSRLSSCALMLVAAASAYVGCADSGEGTTSTAGGGIDWSGAGAGGSFAVGGNGGMASIGGGGSGAMGGAGGSTSSSGGGGSSPGGTLVAIAVGASSGITATSLGGQAWSSDALAEGSSARPAIAATSDGDALAFFLSSGDLRSVAYLNGSFSAPSTHAASTQGAPAYATDGLDGHVAYHGSDFLHYYDQAEPVAPPASPQSFGPTPPGIAALGNEVLLGFAGNDGSLYMQSRDNGQWQAAVNVVGSNIERSPAVIRLTSGPEAMVAWVNEDPPSPDHTKIVYATRTTGTWSAPAVVDSGVFTQDDIALAALPSGEALLAYRGSDGKAYVARYTSGSWSAPFGLATPSLDVASPPSITAGINNQDAEICFVTPAGIAQHASLSGTTWSAPTSIGGDNLTACAIAAIP